MGYIEKERSAARELIFEVSSAVQINVASAGEIFDPKLSMAAQLWQRQSGRAYAETFIRKSQRAGISKIADTLRRMVRKIKKEK